MFGRRMCSSQRERSVLLVFRQSCGGDQQHQGVVRRTGQGSVWGILHLHLSHDRDHWPGAEEHCWESVWSRSRGHLSRGYIRKRFLKSLVFITNDWVCFQILRFILKFLSDIINDYTFDIIHVPILRSSFSIIADIPLLYNESLKLKQHLSVVCRWLMLFIIYERYSWQIRLAAKCLNNKNDWWFGQIICKT